MEIKKININGSEYIFTCYSDSTRNGFKHICHLFRNGREINNGTCYYLNRTWEWYRYQSVMFTAVNNEIAYLKERHKANYKSENNISRLTKKHAEIVNDIIAKDEYINELKTLYNYIHDNLM